MGRHPFGAALFVAHSDVFFHIPHSQRRWGYYIETAAPKSSTRQIRREEDLTTEYTKHTEKRAYRGVCPRLFVPDCFISFQFPLLNPAGHGAQPETSLGRYPSEMQ